MRPVASSTTTPQIWVVFVNVPRCDGLTGFSVADGTKYATRCTFRGFDTSHTCTPSEYQDEYTVFPTRKLLWMTKSPAPWSSVPSDRGVLNEPICTGGFFEKSHTRP